MLHSHDEVTTLKATFQEQLAALKVEQKRKSKSWKKEMEQLREAYERQLAQVCVEGWGLYGGMGGVGTVWRDGDCVEGWEGWALCEGVEG